MFTVGPVQENTFIVRPDGADRAVIVAPGDEAPRLLAALRELGVPYAVNAVGAVRRIVSLARNGLGHEGLSGPRRPP